MHAFALTLVFATALIGSLLLKFWLAARQIRHVASHRSAVPAPFESTISLAAHQRAADYTLAKGRFGLVGMAFGALVLLGWTLLGGLDLLNTFVRGAVHPGFGGMAYQLLLLAAFAAIGGLLDLPFDLYSTFRIEQRFGFNRTTWKLYLTDAVKGAVIGSLIGLPIAALVLWLMAATGTLWWLWAWGAWTIFNLAALVLYPTVIAPLFNTFAPLADESLKARVQALMARCGFAAKGLFVMDGSKRSAHANAYFTGFGAAKRVVFFDTLLSGAGT
jgi:STE24 endopeptidase